MSHGWKRTIERALARSSLVRWAAGRRPLGPAILAYHNVVPTGEEVVGDTSLHLDQRDFADQLDFVAETHDVVALDTLLSDEGDEGGRPRVAITFDDAYQGAITAGLEELAKRAFPATVFVAPGLLGAPGFWWDLIAPNGEGIRPEVRTEALDRLQGRQELVLEWASSRGLAPRALPDHTRPSTPEDLLQAASQPGVRLGAHTWSHPNLTKLDDERLAEELTRSGAWLRERTPSYVRCLSYPYGLAGEREFRAAGLCGYDAAVRVSGGLMPAGTLHRGDGRLSLPRINVPRGLSLDGLALRLWGLLE